MTDGRDLVIAVLREPARAPGLPPADWDRLLRQARRADLLGRLALLMRQGGLLERVPAAPRAHLESAIVLTAAQHLEIRREVARIEQALAPLGPDLGAVLLKGAAYLASDAPAALGRTFDDVDLLVPRARLAEVESHLLMGGWVTTHLSAYDQRYYREWMHELPPMQHATRQTVLDVHHAILPLTARVRPDSALLLAAARPAAPGGSLRVLAPPDMLLHSACHLFHNEEFGHGLRDLSDIDLMLRAWGTEPDWWPALLRRAQALGLQRVLALALHHAAGTLGSPVPEPVLRAAAEATGRARLSGLWQGAWNAVLRSPHGSAQLPGAALARGLLYLRGHALRMPPGLLARHLAVKAWRRHVLRENDA
jgi:hypothetical protein